MEPAKTMGLSLPNMCKIMASLVLLEETMTRLSTVVVAEILVGQMLRCRQMRHTSNGHLLLFKQRLPPIVCLLL